MFGFIFVLGGYARDNYLSHCEKYSINANNWVQISPLKKKKTGFSACVVDGKWLYAVGGGFFSDYNALPDIEKYDIEANEWETISQNAFPKKNATMSFQIS